MGMNLGEIRLNNDDSELFLQQIRQPDRGYIVQKNAYLNDIENMISVVDNDNSVHVEIEGFDFGAIDSILNCEKNNFKECYSSTSFEYNDNEERKTNVFIILNCSIGRCA